MDLVLVPDRPGAYHAYAEAWRAPASERWRDFHPVDPRDPEAVRAFATRLDWRGDRAALAARLEVSLRALGAPDAALANARRLARPDTFAIVAAHQPGLFGGPLFVLWKQLSLLALCRRLDRAEGPHFVPVFWNGSEDHNPAEIGRCTLLDAADDLVHLDLPHGGQERMAQAVPAAVLSPLLAALDGRPEAARIPSLLAQLRDCARGDLGETASRLALQWLGAEGLVVVEPRMLRDLAAPLLGRAFAQAPTLHRRMTEASAAFAAEGFTPPLPIPEAERTLLYRLRDGVRTRIRIRGGMAETEDGLERWLPVALEQAIADQPAGFGPSAALRPVVQAATLPVALFVAGGTELAYHRQLTGLFDTLETPLPLLLPRAAGTILTASQAATLAEIGGRPETLLLDPWDWAARPCGEDSPGPEFTALRAEAEAALDRLGLAFGRSGSRHAADFARAREKFSGQTGSILHRLCAERDEPLKKRAHRLRKAVLPGDRLQELGIGTLHFLARHGADLPARLLARLDPTAPGHHLFTLEEGSP